MNYKENTNCIDKILYEYEKIVLCRIKLERLETLLDVANKENQNQ